MRLSQISRGLINYGLRSRLLALLLAASLTLLWLGARLLPARAGQLTRLHAAAFERPLPPLAICFFGLPRSLARTLPSIHRNVFGALRKAGLGYDAFQHAFQLEVFTNTASTEVNVSLDRDEHLLLAGHVVASEAEDQLAFDARQDWGRYQLPGGNRNRDGYASERNLVRQFHSLSRCMGMVEAREAAVGGRYSAVLFLRPDLMYLDPIDVPAVRHCMSAPDRPCVVVAWWGWDHDAGGPGVNDRFYYASRAAAPALARRGALETLDAYVREEGKPWWAEPYLAWVVAKSGAELITTNATAARVRATGALVDECARSRLSSTAYGAKGLCPLIAQRAAAYMARQQP